MQPLLASKYFEDIVRHPLKLETIQYIVMGNSPGEVPRKDSRLEAEDELQKRRDVQTALINVIDLRKKRDPVKIENALKDLHAAILNSSNSNSIKAIGQPGDTEHFIGPLSDCLKYSDRVWYSPNDFVLFPSKRSPNSLKSAHENIKRQYPNSSPEMIIMRVSSNLLKCDLDLDAPVDLSRFFENAKYRIVGISKFSYHWISYVRKQDTWYQCDDSNVTQVSPKTIDLGSGDTLVLERL